MINSPNTSGFSSQPSSLPPDVVLRVSGVSKKFCRNLRRSMWYGIQDLAGNLQGGRAEGGDLRPEERAEGGNLKAEGEMGRAEGGNLRPEDWREHRAAVIGDSSFQVSGFTPHPFSTISGFRSHPSSLAPTLQVSGLIPHPFSVGAILGLHKHEIDAQFDEIGELMDAR